MQTSVLPGPHGGNLDNKRLGPGSTVYFRVNVPGAGFSAGDGHAIQGDGEFCVTALETSLEGKFRLTVLRADDADPNEDYGFYEFFNTVDVLVMGSNTYQFVVDYGSWPYGDKPVVVLSSRPVEVPESFPDTIEGMNGTPEEIVAHLAERGAKHLYIDGGNVVQQFLNAGLIDRFIITRLPILIGEGIPLFGAIPNDIYLNHVNTKTWDIGFVKTEYEVVKEDQS